MQIRNFSVVALGWTFLILSSGVSAWSVDDNYNNQSVGQRCGSFWQSQEDSTVTTENGVNGSKSCKMKINQGATGWGGGFVYPALRKGDEYWMRFRVFIPAGFDYGVYSAGDTLKFIRLEVKDSSNTTSFLDWEWRREGVTPPYGVILQRDNCSSYNECWQFFGPASDKPTRGVWETYEIYVKLDNVAVDAGGQGRVRAWKNGKLIADLTKRRTINNSGDTLKATHIFSYWNGGAPQTQYLYFDDLVATNVRPSGLDSQGNAYIGMGNFVAAIPPMPPGSIH